MTKASNIIGISRNVISYFIDTFKPEGVKGTYLFSRQLENEEIKNLIERSGSLRLGNKIEI